MTSPSPTRSTFDSSPAIPVPFFVHDGDGSQVTFGEDAQQVAREMRRAKLEMVQLDGQADSALTASVPPEKVGAPICRLAMRKAVSVCH